MRFLLGNLSDLFLFLFFKSILHTNNNIDGNGTIQMEEIENLFVLNYGGKKKRNSKQIFRFEIFENDDTHYYYGRVGKGH